MAKAKKKTATRRSALSRLKSTKVLLLLVFVLGFGGFGIWKLAFSSAATSYPPAAMTKSNGPRDIAASDGKKGSLSCVSVSGNTGYGPLVNCYQHVYEKSNSYSRAGYYSPLTKKFSPSTGKMKVSRYASYNDIGKAFVRKCRNMTNYFAAYMVAETGYGPVSHGQVYRYYRGKWQIKWATYSHVTKNCGVTGSWMDAKVF